MAKSPTKPTTARGAKKTDQPRYCALPVVPPRPIAHGIAGERLRAIFAHGKKWVNGTVLHYHFFRNASWRGTERQQSVVRAAFDRWKGCGIGLEFREVGSPEEAEIRIGFLEGDGSWSYVGRDILTIGTAERTMNFGWDISHDLDTALHEIGHTLGMPHEHQNPHAGIVWDDEAVYAALAAPPNNWDRETTKHNIIRKLDPNEVVGSEWDPDSIMHYPFEAGLIAKPADYANGLTPKGGLSPLDKEYVFQFYPPPAKAEPPPLEPFQSVRLALDPGQQRDFRIEPDETRYYEIQTFGPADTVLVLFEDVDGDYRYVSGDDDSGTDRNARIRARLRRGRKYVARLRLYYAHSKGNFAIMLS